MNIRTGVALPYGKTPEQGGPTAYDAGLLLCGASSEMRALPLLTFDFGDLKEAKHINAGIFQYLGGSSCREVLGSLSESAFPETVKYLCGQPFAAFTQYPGSGRGASQVPHRYELSPRGEDEYQPLAAHIAAWSIEQRQPFKKYLGEAQFPGHKDKVPPVVLAMNVLIFAAFSPVFTHPDLRKWSNSVGENLGLRDFNKTLLRLIGHGVLDRTRIGNSVYYRLNEKEIEPVSGLVDVYMKALEGGEAFQEEGADLIDALRSDNAAMRTLIKQAATWNKHAA